jgi:Domain of unknown function (DUF4189)
MNLNLKTVSLLMVTAGLAIGAPASASSYIGAIAYSPSTTKYGISVNSPTSERAEKVSLGACGKADCTVQFTFAQCGAIARNSKKIGFGKAATRRDADIQALAAAGSGAKVLVSGCNK